VDRPADQVQGPAHNTKRPEDGPGRAVGLTHFAKGGVLSSFFSRGTGREN
ncbi:hypothetical protein PanWU01x14_098790, partial [Parasponia andersonii]